VPQIACENPVQHCGPAQQRRNRLEAHFPLDKPQPCWQIFRVLQALSAQAQPHTDSRFVQSLAAALPLLLWQQDAVILPATH
jgi:hypothetical protein